MESGVGALSGANQGPVSVKEVMEAGEVGVIGSMGREWGTEGSGTYKLRRYIVWRGTNDGEWDRNLIEGSKYRLS